MTDHPRDEFDKVPKASARQGVHRERLIPAGSNGLALKITVGILALLIGLGAYFILPRLGLTGGAGGAAAPSATATDTVPRSADATPAPSASDATAGDATNGASDGTPAGPDSTEDADPDATSSSTAGDDARDTDQAQTVNVLNGTGTPGLASVAAGRLASAGWTSALPGNWAGAPVDASVVFYNGAAQRDSAEAVAEELGISSLVDSADVSPEISVVLGPEFQ